MLNDSGRRHRAIVRRPVDGRGDHGARRAIEGTPSRPPTCRTTYTSACATWRKGDCSVTTLNRPLALLAELTYRCPLQCPYCSNPLELGRYRQGARHRHVDPRDRRGFRARRRPDPLLGRRASRPPRHSRPHPGGPPSRALLEHEHGGTVVDGAMLDRLREAGLDHFSSACSTPTPTRTTGLPARARSTASARRPRSETARLPGHAQRRPPPPEPRPDRGRDPRRTRMEGRPAGARAPQYTGGPSGTARP